ncbi:MAG: hypothetical protein RIQ54_66 [Candidatus Parcubacteria bacterium]|jgi:hypothetical protein
MRYVYGCISLFLVTLSLFLGREIWRLRLRSISESMQLSEVRTVFNAIVDDHNNLQRDLEYLQQPDNLEKELRSRFNYRKHDETLVIIVPDSVTSTTSSSVP